jgi:cytochrome c oxidase assembly protein subunit 15
MTGSGMGCPDWPKCFGYIIPPTDSEQVEWQPNREFEKGQMIVVNDALWLAKEDFTSKDVFDWEHWEKYTKHDYAIFNVFHTWTEYINRLIGAFSGIPVLLMVVFSLSFWKTDKILFFSSLATLFMLGFEAWLGKVVVDGNLIPGQITLHMFGALLIILLIIFSIRKSSPKPRIAISKNIYWLVFGLTLFSALQIFLGTNVREEVDYLIKAGTERANLIEKISVIFKVHRSYSIMLVLLNAALFWMWWKAKLPLKLIAPLVGVVLVEVGLGIILTYAGFPKFAQPTHLLLGFIMMGILFHLILLLRPTQKFQ